MNKIGNQFTSIQQVTEQFLGKAGSTGSKETAKVSFEDILIITYLLQKVNMFLKILNKF